MNKERWIEIKFVLLCFKIYENLRDYVMTVQYIEILADIAKISRTTAVKLLRQANQINSLRPSKAEFVCIARQNKCTIQKIMEVLNISKSYYIELSHHIDLNASYPQQSSIADIANMDKLLKAHEKIKESGI